MYAAPQSPGGATVIPDPDVDGGLTVIWMEVHLMMHTCIIITTCIWKAVHWTMG